MHAGARRDFFTWLCAQHNKSNVSFINEKFWIDFNRKGKNTVQKIVPYICHPPYINKTWQKAQNWGIKQLTNASIINEFASNKINIYSFINTLYLFERQYAVKEYFHIKFYQLLQNISYPSSTSVIKTWKYVYSKSASRWLAEWRQYSANIHVNELQIFQVL